MPQKIYLDPIVLSSEDHTIQDAHLQRISSTFITVREKEKKLYRHHLGQCLKLLIENMKEVNTLFKLIFQKDIPSGSFWDNLKIGKPVEFDKNFVLYMPRSMRNALEIQPATPSFVMLKVKSCLERPKEGRDLEIIRRLDPFIDAAGLINSEKIRSWMESVVCKAINRIPQTDYRFKHRKSGPAMTVEVTVCSDNTWFEIDIVPAFEFSKDDWLPDVCQYPDHIPSKPWHVVPKPVKHNENTWNGKVYPEFQLWRLSFHEQESAMISGSRHLKAVLKMLKKLRDNKVDQHLLTSYAIKTVFLREMTNHDDGFWRESLIKTFLHMLRILTQELSTQKLPFYWDERFNLLGCRSYEQRAQLYHTFLKAYNKISAGLESGSEPLVIAQELLTREQFRQFCDKTH